MAKDPRKVKRRRCVWAFETWRNDAKNPGSMSAIPSDSAVPPVEKSNKFPPGVPFIVGNEAAERFSFYGMRAILYVHMVSLYLNFPGTREGLDPVVLAAAEAKATQVTHLFNAGVYAFPMIGAILADRLLGKYKVIFWISMIYCAGHAVLSAGDHYAVGMYLGLALIAVGSGGIKPCVSANVGDQFTKANAHLVPKIYQIFYFSINFGSFFSTLLIPWVYNHPALGKWAPSVAFGIPGILMGVATFVFWLGRSKFVKVPPKPGGMLGFMDFIAAVFFFLPFAAWAFGWEFIHEKMMHTSLAAVFTPAAQVVGDMTPEAAAAAAASVGAAWASRLVILAFAVVSVGIGLFIFTKRQEKQADPGFLSVLLYAIRNQKNRKPGEGYFSVAKEKYGEEAAEGPAAVMRIMLVFSMVSVFWALFDQHSSTWIKQAGLMDLKVNLFGLKTLELTASQIPALNPLMVMMIIPMMNFLVYAPLEKAGINFSPLRRMTAGMALAAIAFMTAAILQISIESAAAAGTGNLSVGWQMIQYWLITTAEVLVSITGLEFAYTQAPRSMKSTIMGFWLLCVTFGNLLVAFLAPLEATLALSTFFWVFTGLMGGATLVFMVMAYFYKGKSYLQA
jgi:proton-dependent oligopeptide transporter, POT family